MFSISRNNNRSVAKAAVWEDSMAEAPCRFEREQQEPYDARVSRTVLWGAGGEVPHGLPDLPQHVEA